MFIELSSGDATFLLNIHCIKQVYKNGENGCLVYIQDDERGPYCVKEPYEYLRNILLNR